MNMIYNEAIQVPDGKLLKKGLHKSLVQSSIRSQKFIRLSQNQIKDFINHQQIIHCVDLLEKGLSNHKLAKLYFILFQVSMACSKNETFRNFLSRQNFNERLSTAKIDKLNLGQKIVLNKIANFMDTFRTWKDRKNQINSLVNQYHQYRILDSFKENSFVVEVCAIIKQYLFGIVNFLLTEVQFTQWNLMKDSVFEDFYLHYSQLCTICKRINYIKCSLLVLPLFKFPQSISSPIEERHISTIQKMSVKGRQSIPVQIYKGLSSDKQTDQSEEKDEKERQKLVQENKQLQRNEQKEIKQMKKPQKQIKLAAISNLSVKRKLKVMNQLINKLQQQI